VFLGFLSNRLRLAALCSPGGMTPLFHSQAICTFREPRAGQNVRLTALREYLRKLGVAPDEFIQLLEDC
jgi:hypothetical protein